MRPSRSSSAGSPSSGAAARLEGAEAVCNAGRDLGLDVVQRRGLARGQEPASSRLERSGTRHASTCWRRCGSTPSSSSRPSGDEVSTRRAHAAYCIVLAEEGNPYLMAERADWLARYDVEDDNFRAALDWLVETRNSEWALRLGLALFRFWERREHLTEGRQRLLAILGLRGSDAATSEWAVATAYAATMTTVSDQRAALILHQQALDAFRALGDKKRRGRAVEFARRPPPFPRRLSGRPFLFRARSRRLPGARGSAGDCGDVQQSCRRREPGR